MKHTKGPWRICPTNEFMVETGCTGEDHGEQIGEMNSEANAKLVAAAPEMLEALKAIVAELQKPLKVNREGYVFTHNL